MQARCLDLADPAAADPSITGAKAAGLAAAHAVGLPVLPGVVVPVDEAGPVVRAVTAALLEGNEARARLAALEIEPDDALLTEIADRIAGFSEPLIVRSSSPLEADGTWSGAFSSFHGIQRDEVRTALRGCWGAAFSVGVLDRARHTVTDPGQLGLAVLIQPEIDPDIGGIARLRSDGSVRITATRGPLVPLMAGDVEGDVTLVGPDDEAGPGTDGDRALLLEVAALSRRVGDELGHRLIEWLAVDGSIHLLQSLGSLDDEAAPLERGPQDEVFATPIARRVALLTQRFPGQLGDALILPWAVAMDPPPLGDRAATRPSTTDRDEAIAAFGAARSAASSLVTQIWGGSPRSSQVTADRVLRQLRGDEPLDAVRALGDLAQPASDTVETVLSSLEQVRGYLVGRGIVDSDATFWRLADEDVDRALKSGTAPREQRLGVSRWEPFLHSVVSMVGEPVSGIPAAPGAGAGPAFPFDESPGHIAPSGRYVIVANQPSPALSSLLWNAAGLVTRAGSTAAHLIEFAHSIGVPTVVGCDLPLLASADGPPLIAVDGDRGEAAYAWLVTN